MAWPYVGLLCVLICLQSTQASTDVTDCPKTLDGKSTQEITDNTGCPIAFDGKCKCGLSRYPNSPHLPDAKKRYIVNCTNTGFTNASMLTCLPIETEVLIFTGNRIGPLPKNVLGNTKDYDDLEIMDLSNNGITFIPGKAFHKVFNVRTLILNHNDIEISERERPRVFYGFESLENLHLTNAFTESVNSSFYLLSLEDIFFESDLRLLVKLHLEQNEIYTIGRNASIFCQLPSLNHLYLGDNRLSDMDFRLDCMPGLTYVDLQRNNINRLSSEAISTIEQFSRQSNFTIELRKNPFICDCYIWSFVSWLKSTKVVLRDSDDYKCAEGISDTLIGKTLKNLDKNQLQCPTRPVHIEEKSSSTSAVATLSFILAFVTAILLAIVYYQRMKIRNHVMPYYEYVTRKIGYSGLASEEAPKVVAV
ncbi:trophoblast glycoprotein [Hyalella azteca]|uniref:Trophoblast glycoprotein n=1 Tax=Hyalella azteca TaxID=294128 RepID=A0A8B7NBQ6_HYAAZ|nr:trophoblast glycoprotein [Hyalella azteca]